MQTPRVLIAYATRYGSTREIAGIVGAVLETRGFSVDVSTVTEVEDLNQYEAVIVGSAIREKEWLPEAKQFVQAHREELQRVPLIYFAVGMTLADPTPERYQEEYSYLDEIQAIVKPLDIGLFAGSLEISQLSREQKMKVLIKGLPRGDFRHWHDIRAWADEVADILMLEISRLSQH